jgi:hypothetical protein
MGEKGAGEDEDRHRPLQDGDVDRTRVVGSNVVERVEARHAKQRQEDDERQARPDLWPMPTDLAAIDLLPP